MRMIMVIGDSIKTELITAVKEMAVEFGNFTLASGRKSNFYLDCRRLTLCSSGLYIVTQAMHIAVTGLGSFDAVGGPSLGADPIVGGLLHDYGIRNEVMRGFLVRKEAKTHGKGGLVIGSVKAEDRVILVEDVATSGESLLWACDVVRRELGVHIVGAVVIVDRLAGARETFEKRGIRFASLLTIEDLDLK
jgi:orotate phosphoribosyltransferase